MAAERSYGSRPLRERPDTPKPSHGILYGTTAREEWKSPMHGMRDSWLIYYQSDNMARKWLLMAQTKTNNERGQPTNQYAPTLSMNLLI